MSKVAKRMDARPFYLAKHERELLRAGLMALRCGAGSANYPERGRHQCIAQQIDALHSLLSEPSQVKGPQS